MYKKIVDNILDLIGCTPLIRLHTMVTADMAQILAKLESFNPGGSVKDRVALAIIEDAEHKGLIKPGSTIIEPTSGNTGIGLAMVCAVKGYRCIITMPETLSLERIYILNSYGAEVFLTPGKKGINGAIEKAQELHKKITDSFIPQQFQNHANPAAHKRTTAREIIEATGGDIDAFVTGVGTGGTITGVGEALKEYNPAIRIVAVEPEKSPVLSGGKPGNHKIQGIGSGFIPEVLNMDVIDEIIRVNDAQSFKTATILARKEGLFMGISSGAALLGALEVAKRFGPGKTVVVLFPDTGERYFSVEQYFKA